MEPSSGRLTVRNSNLCLNQNPVVFHPDIVFSTLLIFQDGKWWFHASQYNTAEPFVKMFETIDEEVLLDDNDVTFNWLVYS